MKGLFRQNCHALFLATAIYRSTAQDVAEIDVTNSGIVYPEGKAQEAQVEASGQITAPTSTMWSYQDSSTWSQASSKCATGPQSPIDIIPASTLRYSTLSALQLNEWPNCKSAMFATTQYTWEASFLREDLCMDKMWIDWEGHRYFLQKFDFHSPSETSVNGRFYDMEAHFHHEDMDGNFLIIAVLMKVGTENSFFNHIMWNFPSTMSEKAAKAAIALNPYKTFFPARKSYWTFMGSLSEPPCTGDVRWIVLKTPVEISAAQRNAYRAAMSAVPSNGLGMNPNVPYGVTAPWSTAQGINNRPVQPLKGRIIYEFPPPDHLDVPPLIGDDQPQVQLYEVDSARPTQEGFLAMMPLSAFACAVFVGAVALGYFLGSPSRFSTATSDDRDLLMTSREQSEAGAADSDNCA